MQYLASVISFNIVGPTTLVLYIVPTSVCVFVCVCVCVCVCAVVTKIVLCNIVRDFCFKKNQSKVSAVRCLSNIPLYVRKRATHSLLIMSVSRHCLNKMDKPSTLLQSQGQGHVKWPTMV